MQPWLVVERAQTAGGATLELARRGDEWAVRCDGQPLMSSRQHGSEEALAALAFERWNESRARVLAHEHTSTKTKTKTSAVLIGGLGLGFTARAALDWLGANDKLVVVEFSEAIARWNRTHVGDLAQRPLDDPRVDLHIADAVAEIQAAREAYALILLDIDNGPSALVRAENDRLYGERGIAHCLRALAPGGVLAVWSAGPDERYLARLARAGARAEQVDVAARGGRRGVRHTIFLAQKTGP